MKNTVVIGLLAAAAAFWNLHAPTVFFDSQIMLGGSLAVFALLQFGWPGLAVGIAALGVTAIRWGHPFELLIGTTFLVWLKIFLDRFNGGWSNRENGRVVLAALGFWLVAGIVLEVLLFNRVFGVASVKALGLGLKEAVTALVNTTLGFLAYLAVRWWQARGAQRSVSARGIVFAAILAAITIPGVGLTMTLSGQLKRSVLENYLADLRHFGTISAADGARGKAGRDVDSFQPQEDMAYLARRGDSTVTGSNAVLFERLARDFEIESPSRTQLPGLDILKPKTGGPVIVSDDNSYWLAKFTVPDPAKANGTLDVTVVQSTPRMIQTIDHELLLPSLALLFAIMSIGALASEALGLAVDRQFRSVIGPLQGHTPNEPMPDLASSRIRELETIVTAVNERSHRVNELGDSLHRALAAKNAAHEEITGLIDGLPMAITISSIEPNPTITFLNEQFVRTFGYTIEDIPSVEEWARKAYPDEDQRREAFKKWDTTMARALETKGLVESIETRVTCKDGTVRDTLVNAVVLEDKFVIGLLDITERKLAEQRLAESEERLRGSEAAYRTLIENSPVGIFGTGSDGRITLFNPSMLRILGIDTAEAGFAQKFYVNAEDRAEFMRRLRQDHKVEHFEVPLRHADGHIVWADYNARIASGDPDGKFTIEGFFTDITERKTAEEKLRISEEKYRNFFNLPLVGTAITSRTKGWIEVNDQTCEILGYPREELFKKTWADITHPDDLAADEAQLGRMLRREIDGYTLEKRFIRKDGSIVHTILTGGCGRIGNATPDIFFVNILDISERKRLEEELRISEERHRLLADNAVDVINVIDLNGKLLYVSPSVEKLIGYTQEEALKLSVEDILAPEAAAGARAGLAATAAAIESGGPLPEFQGEFPHRHKDGHTVWAEATSTCMVDKNGKYIANLIVTRDISERKRLGDELAAARERERNTEAEMRATLETKLKTSLNAAAVAHEINQPLSRILLRARMDLEKSHGAGSDTLRALVADAERVVNTIEKMKVLLRNVETVQRPVNLTQIITSSLHQLKQPLRQNRVSVTHTGPEQNCMLLGDEVQLQMAFTNILRNAVEAIAQSGTDKREISIERIPRDGTVDIVIGDSGPGWPGGTIDDALLATSKPGGSGIGLYIVKTTVANHRGTIHVGRSPLGGAEFRLTFARVPSHYPAEGTR